MSVARAAHALRLNRSFPDLDRFVAHLQLAIQVDPTPDPHSGLPRARSWSRVRVEKATAQERLADLQTLDLQRLPPAEREHLAQRQALLQALLQAELLPSRQVHVALRHREEDRASYLVTVDRQDLATGLVARYTLVLSDTPGKRIPQGELELHATERFADKLELLSTQDASLAFAVLEAEGLDVHEVTRGVIGPAVVGGAGPQLFALTAPALSAVLERASRDLHTIRVDDPLPEAVTVPTDDAGFGLVAARKWAVAAADRSAVREWLTGHGHRALVYGYEPSR